MEIAVGYHPWTNVQGNLNDNYLNEVQNNLKMSKFKELKRQIRKTGWKFLQIQKTIQKRFLYNIITRIQIW